MLLPDLDVLPGWTGHTSLGALLLDKEPHDREAHATEHKVLKDLRTGRSVSLLRIRKLFKAVSCKWSPGDNVFRSDIYDQSLGLPQDEAPIIVDDFDKQGAFLFWNYLAKNLPAKRGATRSLLDGLVQRSMYLHKVYHDRGNHSVALALSDIGQHPSAGISQRHFLGEMAELFKVGKENVARVELAAFGVLLLSAVFLHENEDSVEASRAGLDRLFAADLGRVDPMRAFSHWLEQLRARTGYATDRLLLDGFVFPKEKTGTHMDTDPKNLLRNPRRYRNGDQVPSFEAAKGCLRSLRPDFDKQEIDKWNVELEQREFGLIFVLLAANSVSGALVTRVWRNSKAAVR
ncbi:hypothetical protein ACGYK5_17265 [Sulfitobacter sp. 1A16787]|uniref:hypothetical protein n=1 Tax=Sulfitobacter sp. 1A16787 TaxID=3368571 RepID=UPI00374598A7